MKTAERPGGNMRLSDRWLGVAVLALAAAMFSYTLTFPAFPGQKYGPALFPRILAVGMALCAALLIFGDWRRRAGGATVSHIAVDPQLRDRTRFISFALIPGAIIAYLLLADRLGFIPTAFMLLLGLMLWFRVRVPMALIVSVVMTGLLNWFFAGLMRVPLPRGLFMQVFFGG